MEVVLSNPIKKVRLIYLYVRMCYALQKMESLFVLVRFVTFLIRVHSNQIYVKITRV